MLMEARTCRPALPLLLFSGQQIQIKKWEKKLLRKIVWKSFAQSRFTYWA